MSKFDAIILSGGATRGFAQLGCLYKYGEDVYKAKRFIGTSVGALIALLIVCGYPIKDIMRLSMKISFSLPDLKEIATTIIHGYGIMDENPYIVAITKQMRKKYGYIPTMKELYEITGKELVITGSCVTTGEGVYISYITYPDMPCTVAVNISSRVPYIFTPILYDGHLYLDGSIHDHFPLSQIKDGEKALAIFTTGKAFGQIISISDIHPMRYFWNIINSMTRGKYTNLTSTDTLTLHIISCKGGNMSASLEEIINMFMLGLLSVPSR